MKKLWEWIATHKWVVLVGLTALAALSLIFVDTDGVADKEAAGVQNEIVE